MLMRAELQAQSGKHSMFWKRRSYSRGDVMRVVHELREIEAQAEEEAPAIPEGLLAWARKNPENKRKVNRAFGVIAGYVFGRFDGRPEDLGRFLHDVIRATYNYGFGANFGKMMTRTHARLSAKQDGDYVAGRREGLLQSLTAENHYLRNRLTW